MYKHLLKAAAVILSLLVGFRVISLALMLANQSSDTDVFFAFLILLGLALLEAAVFKALFSKSKTKEVSN